MRQYGGGPGGASDGGRSRNGDPDGAMDAALVTRRVRRHFGDLVDERANPLVVALALQDNSSVGLQIHAEEFAELHRNLRQCLKREVDHNYQGFNSSVGAYRGVVSGLNHSHALIAQTQESLKHTREQLAKRKPGIRELQQSSLRYKRMLELLNVMERLKEIPALYETQMAAKQFRQAHNILSEGLETINARDLLKVPAIQSIHRYIGSQQGALFNMLVDELLAHLYLTSPYTEPRWQSIQQQQHYSKAALDEFVESLSQPVSALEDSSRVEEDSFVYIRSLLETLMALDSLGPALETIQSRIVIDFKALHDRAVADIVRQAGLTPDKLINASHPDKEGLLEELQSVDQTLVQRLARTFYARMTASLEAHCAVSEVCSRLNANYDLKLVSKTVQSRVRAFLLEYIDTTHGPRPRPRGRSFDTGSKYTKSKVSGPLFQFTPAMDDPVTAQEYHELRESLKTHVPGLLEATKAPAADQGKGSEWNMPFADTSKEAHLQVVARAHILNIRVLLEPSADFMEDANALLGDQALNTFLDTFLQSEFVPRLQSAFQHAFDEISESPESLEPAADWRSRSQLPLVSAATSFFDVLTLLCEVLNTGKSFREDYTEMLVDLLDSLKQYFDKKSHDHVVGKRKVVFNLSISSGLRESLQKLHEATQQGHGGEYSDLPFYWSRRHTAQNQNPPVVLGDLLDMDAFRTLSLLATSLEWLDLRLRDMRRVSGEGTIDSPVLGHKSSSITTTSANSVRKRWTLFEGWLSGESKDRHPVAILAGNQLTRYDNIVRSLGDMSLRILCLLRTDFMCRIVYYLDQMVVQGDFYHSKTSRPQTERDLVIESLQRDVSLCVRTADSHLTASDRNFLLHGVARLMNELFILESENISDMNEAGHDKMYTNIFALQQLLTSVVSDPREVDFSRAASYYDLLWLTPTLILEKARDGKTDLSLADMKLLLKTKNRITGNTTAASLTNQLKELNDIYHSGKRKSGGSITSTTATQPPPTPSRAKERTSSAVKSPVAPSVPERRNTVSVTTQGRPSASSPSLPRLDTQSAAPQSPPRIRSAAAEVPVPPRHARGPRSAEPRDTPKTPTGPTPRTPSVSTARTPASTTRTPSASTTRTPSAATSKALETAQRLRTRTGQ